MRRAAPVWLWVAIAAGVLAALALLATYAWLPADGATGDLESFSRNGFGVKWLLEERPGGLRPGDVIVRAGGHTMDEWLAGAPRGPEWRSGGVVTYDIMRDGQPLTLQIRLAPVPFVAILRRWWLQLAAGGAAIAVGLIVLYRRPWERAARMLVLVCVTLGLQYWGDAWNFQFATVPWRWPLWLHVSYEVGMYSVTVASMLLFALLFPLEHPLIRRWPRLVPIVAYVAQPVSIAMAMIGALVLVGGLSAALRAGNVLSWAVAIAQIGAALAAGARSVRRARDPVARAQVRWIVWWGGVGFAVLMPGYVLPQLLNRPPLVSHPAAMIFVVLLPWTFAIAILRYRLFDIDVIINRTLVYGTLTVLLAGLYVILVRLFTLIVPIIARRQNDMAIMFIATLGIALAFAPLRRRVQSTIDRAFYRTRLDYQRLLAEASARLAISIDLDQVAALLAGELPRQLQISWARLTILDSEGARLAPVGGDGPFDLAVAHPLAKAARHLAQPIVRLQPPAGLDDEARAFLDQHGVELAIPLLIGGDLVGVYYLGSRQSGDAYPGEEVRLLYLLGQQAAIAVQNSRLFQAEREQRRLAETLLDEKEILLQEIHHRVKNNLQIVSSLLYLQSRQIRDPETLEMFLESQGRVRSMALIHETLYQAGDLARVNCDEYVRALANFLYHSYGAASGVQVCVEVTGVWLGIDTAVPCGLIINELVSNALKHAFPDSRPGRVTIRMAGDSDGRMVLSVADDGVGLPEGFDWRAGGSLGLQLVRRLAQQIDGTIDVHSGPGSIFTVVF